MSKKLFTVLCMYLVLVLLLLMLGVVRNADIGRVYKNKPVVETVIKTVIETVKSEPVIKIVYVEKTKTKYIELPIVKLLKMEEGFRSKPYFDRGFIAIGYGTLLYTRKDLKLRNFNIVIDEDLALKWMLRDINKKEILLNSVYNISRIYNKLSPDKKTILISMAYQMGVGDLLKFEKLWDALDKGNFNRAYKDALNSVWARQTPERADRHARVLRGESIKNVYSRYTR